VRRAAPLVLALLAASLPGCTGARDRGEARPTVAGGAGPAYPDLATAKAAFTRSNGPMSAVLVDTAWLRYEPDPDRAEERHPDYFRGLTSFQVVVATLNFVRPTDETYVLEDSTGTRVTSKPERYVGDTVKGLGAKHSATFDLTFSHAMSRDVRWLRLTRQGEGGGTVEWSFPAE
jgi:hypothetical protein